MYKRIRTTPKGFFVLISILTLLFVAIPVSFSHCADFKSEDELVDETKSNVDKHLNEEWHAPSAAKEESVAAKPANTIQEAPPLPKEPPQEPAKDNFVSAKNTVDAQTVSQTEESPVKKDPPAQNSSIEQDVPPEIKKEDPPSDVTQVDPETGFETPSDKEAMGEDIEFVQGIKDPIKTKPLVEPVLKKMDVNKIGASPYYETYEGLRLLKYFTVAQRVEIYQEARPIDSYIMDAHAIPQIRNNPWNCKSDYRTQITPVFTRAYGTEFTMSDPKNKEGQIRYTIDYRDIYRNYYPKYPEIKVERWDQNEILFMHAKHIEPIGWNYTSNLGYRYSTMNFKMSDPGVPNDKSSDEVRHTYFASMSLAPNERLEWFGQAEYYKSMHIRAYYDYRPDHFLGRTEVRMRSKDLKTMYVPSFSYSKDFYYPFADTYQKYEIQFRIGRDFTKRFSASSTAKYIMGLRDNPDNKGPTYGIYKNPFKDKAYTISLENRISYNVYDRLYVQGGFDISNGINWSIFDNLAFLGGLEYYAPGMIRANVGWTGNYYYNIQDFLSSVYFKVYFFM